MHFNNKSEKKKKLTRTRITESLSEDVVGCIYRYAFSPNRPSTNAL